MTQTEAVTPATVDEGTPDRAAVGAGARPILWTAILVGVAVGLPTVVALGVGRHPQWYPLLDLAQIEMRVRDVGTSATPLVGPYGRIEAYRSQGHHPGPLGYYGLWPVYRLFGSTAWALLVATAVGNLVAAATAVWVARRRGGAVLAAGVALMLAVLIGAYGPLKVVLPWNPYLALLWWVVLLLAVWSVIDGDLPLLPLIVFAASYCLQNHVGYMGLVAGLGLVTAVALVRWWVPRRRDRAALRRLLAWGGFSLILGLVLWLPPLVQQVTNRPGNLAIIRTSFTAPTTEPVGLGDAVGLWLRYLDPSALVEEERGLAAVGYGVGSPWVGGVVLGAWVLAAAWAWRSRAGRTGAGQGLVGLHAVVAVVVLLQLSSISRITGTPWHYLVVWAWGTLALLLLATIWSLVEATRARRAPAWLVPRWRTVALVGLGLPLLVLTVANGYRAAHLSLDLGSPPDTRSIAALAPATLEALESGRVPGGGREGRYQVVWSANAHATPAAGLGLLLELERNGFDAGALYPFGSGDHRVMPPDEATARVHYVVGPDHITAWRRAPGAVEVGAFEPRSAEEIVEYDRLHAEVVAELRSAGREDLLEDLDENLLATVIQPDLPLDAREPIIGMLRLGLPAAVFVATPDVTADV